MLEVCEPASTTLEYISNKEDSGLKSDRAMKRQAQILDAAYTVFSKKGYHETSIADIAEVLEIGHGTFYRYFENKLDIFSHVIDLVVDKILSVIAEEDPFATNDINEYQQQVLRIGAKLFDLFMNDLALSQIVFEEALGIDEIVTRKLNVTFDRLAEFTEQYFDNGASKGFMRTDFDRTTAAYALNAMIFEGIKQIMRSDDKQKSQQVWIATVSTFLLHGLTK